MAKSHAFLATIPECSVEALGKLHSWAQNTSVKSDIIMAPNGDMKLICIRKEAKSLRELQRLVRTLLIKWEVELPSKMIDWIQLIDPEQFDEIKNPQGNAELDLLKKSNKENPADEQHTEEPSESPPVSSDPPRTAQAEYQSRFGLTLPRNLLKDNGALFVLLHATTDHMPSRTNTLSE